MTLRIKFLIGLFIGVLAATVGIASSVPVSNTSGDSLAEDIAPSVPVNIPSNVFAGVVSQVQMDVPDVPFYSQFYDISSPKWQKLGCGIADLAMLIEFYNPGVVSVDTLLQEGIASGAFIDGAGWSHRGLALLAQSYDLQGQSYDLSHLDMDTAFAQLEEVLREGPVIASVRYKLEPQNPIPHLVVINGVSGSVVYYNDPAAVSAGQKISIQNFTKAWKKRFIVVRL